MFRKDDLAKNVEAGKIEEAEPREERNRVEDQEITWIHSRIDNSGQISGVL